MRPVIPPISAPGNVFSDGDPAVQGDGTMVPSVWLNDMQAATINLQTEVVNLLASKSISPSTSNNSQLLDAIRLIVRSTVRLGEVQWFNGLRDKIPADFVAADGQVLSRATFPEWWAKISAGDYVSVTEALWAYSGDNGAHNKNRGRYSLGANDTVFRPPDLNGASSDSVPAAFLRGDANGRLSSTLGAIGQMFLNSAPNLSGAVGGGAISGGQWLAPIPVGQNDGALLVHKAPGSTMATATGTPLTSDYNYIELDASRQNAAYGRFNSTEIQPNQAVGVWIIRAKYPF